VDLRQLECFVAVAEELHFRRAGERLGISQSALSEKIAALEAEVGVQLLFRTTRHVSLTQAGAELLRDATEILRDVDRLVTNARQAAATGLERIRVSGVDEAITILLPPALRAFRQSFPDVHVQVLEISSSDHHLKELAGHRADIAFIRTAVDDGYVASELLYRQPVVAVVARAHPLAKAETIGPEDLVDQDTVGYPRHSRPILHELLWSGFRDIGAQPRIICEVIDKTTLMQFVAKGLGLALAPAWTERIAPDGLAFVPYRQGTQGIDLYIARRKKDDSKTIDAFVAAVKEAAVAAHPNFR